MVGGVDGGRGQANKPRFILLMSPAWELLFSAHGPPPWPSEPEIYVGGYWGCLWPPDSDGATEEGM